MANGIEESISILYEMVQDAWSLPLGNDKCVVERDKVLNLLDEISSQLPGELKQARTIVESRNEIITNAKKEAEDLRRQAEARAKQMVSRDEIVQQAQAEAEEISKRTQERIRELRRVTNQYMDDALKQTEDTVAASLAQLKDARAKFNELSRQQSAPAESSPIIKDV